MQLLEQRLGIEGLHVRGPAHHEQEDHRLRARAQVGWNDFLQIWSACAEATADKDAPEPAELIRAVIDSKYKDYLENEYPDYRERLQDLEQLAVFAEREQDLNKFLADASLHESYAAGQVKDAEADGNEEKLVLSTIHQAKGLEWSAVFILNVSAGQFPSERSLREPKGLEEERRLFYVAVTRAKKHLYFTYPLVGSFDSMLNGPSPFLEEIRRESVEHHALEGDTVFTDPSDGIGGITYEKIDEPVRSFLKSIDEL